MDVFDGLRGRFSGARATIVPTSASALDGDGSRDAHRCAQASALVGSLRQSVFARLAEYEDVNDAGRARCDPAMHWMLGDKRAHSRAFSHARRAASRPSGSRHLKTFALANLSPSRSNLRAARREASRSTWVSSMSPTHGDQAMSVWNGRYACTSHHPLFMLNQVGDVERAAFRRCCRCRRLDCVVADLLLLQTLRGAPGLKRERLNSSLTNIGEAVSSDLPGLDQA